MAYLHFINSLPSLLLCLFSFFSPLFSCLDLHKCRDHYFTSATWITPTELCVIWLNRPQNVSVVTVCKSPLWICQEVSRHWTFSKQCQSQLIHSVYRTFSHVLPLLPLNRLSVRECYVYVCVCSKYSLVFINIHPRLLGNCGNMNEKKKTLSMLTFEYI